MPKQYDLSESVAAAVLYVVLSAFTVLAVGAAVRDAWLRRQGADGARASSAKSLVQSFLYPSDHFLSARNSAPWTTIAVSYFASGMGAWIVYGTTEMGATPSLSWWGVIGYSAASGVPALLLFYLGPKLRDRMDRWGNKGFSSSDFALARFGRLMQLHVSAVSCFYMYIYLVSEFTTIANVYALLVGRDTTGSKNEGYTTSVTISVAAFTLFYTTVAGLPASIFTDKFQGLIVVILCFTLLLACTTASENAISKSEFDKASNWTNDGFIALVTLFIAICSAELFNQGSWQRVWASKTNHDLRVGMSVGCLLIFLVMMFFGIMGMIAYANDPDAYDNFSKLAFLSFFDLLLPMGKPWWITTLVVLTTLNASSVDTLQNGLASVLSRDLTRHKLSMNWSRLVVLAFNIPAIIQASQRFDVIQLFLVADLVCSTAVMPLFFGLMEQDIELFSGRITIPAPTEVGSFLGCISGLVAVIVNGQINGVNKAQNPYTGKVYERGPLSYFWLTNGYDCALCGKKTMWTFIIVPLVAGFMTFVFTKLDLLLRGENRARQPLLPRDLFLPCLAEDDTETGSMDMPTESNTEGADRKSLSDGKPTAAAATNLEKGIELGTII
mmetsp:Transcript_3998/g.11723  ORF Transcript_3998/g.11723 Transcript_3998/m.11723 type:complete len:611 (-) Transcript_3998:181-2013(-)